MHHKGFLDADKTISDARLHGKSVPDYVETLWGIPGHSKRIIQWLEENTSLPEPPRCLEIGPGTGRYLEKTLQLFSPSHYDLYETDKNWNQWLTDQFPYPPMQICEADGFSLAASADNSMDLCLAHGVFVYLDTMVTFKYLNEMTRCLRNDGYLFFDIIDMGRPDMLTVINNEIEKVPGWLIPLDKKLVMNFLCQHDCRLLNHKQWPYGKTVSDYLLFQKQVP